MQNSSGRVIASSFVKRSDCRAAGKYWLLGIPSLLCLAQMPAHPGGRRHPPWGATAGGLVLVVADNGRGPWVQYSLWVARFLYTSIVIVFKYENHIFVVHGWVEAAGKSNVIF